MALLKTKAIVRVLIFLYPSLGLGDLVHTDNIEPSVTTGSSIASDVDISSDTSGEDLFNY